MSRKIIHERQFGFVDKINELNRNDTFEMQLYRLCSVIFTRIALRNLQSRNRVMYSEGHKRHKRLLEETMRKFFVASQRFLFPRLCPSRLLYFMYKRTLTMLNRNIKFRCII